MPHRLFRKTLVIHDDSKQANRAFERALALTLWAESELHAMSVSESPPQFAASVAEVNDHKETAEAAYDDFAAELRRQAAGKEVSLEPPLSVRARCRDNCIVHQGSTFRSGCDRCGSRAKYLK